MQLRGTNQQFLEQLAESTQEKAFADQDWKVVEKPPCKPKAVNLKAPRPPEEIVKKKKPRHEFTYGLKQNTFLLFSVFQCFFLFILMKLFVTLRNS